MDLAHEAQELVNQWTNTMPVDDEWRERFAQAIMEYAKQAIVAFARQSAINAALAKKHYDNELKRAENDQT